MAFVHFILPFLTFMRNVYNKVQETIDLGDFNTNCWKMKNIAEHFHRKLPTLFWIWRNIPNALYYRAKQEDDGCVLMYLVACRLASQMVGYCFFRSLYCPGCLLC